MIKKIINCIIFLIEWLDPGPECGEYGYFRLEEYKKEALK